MKKTIAFILVSLSVLQLFSVVTWSSPVTVLAEADVTISKVTGENTVKWGANGSTNVGKIQLSKNESRLGLIRFNLPTIPQGEVLTGATLTLYPSDNITTTTNPIKIARAQGEDDWDELVLTYNDASSYLPANYSITGLKLPDTTKNNPVNIDVTSLIRGDYINGKNNTTIVLTLDATSGSDLTFRSKEAGQQYTPKLMIQSEMLSEDDISVNLDKELLDLGDTAQLTKNLNLPHIGQNGSSITWQSSDNSVISNEGQIIRPLTEDSKTAVLTATLTKQAATTTKQFTITVLNIKYPTDDTYSQDNNTNYGKSTTLQIREDNRIQSFIKFELPVAGSNKTVKSAVLRLYKTNNIAGNFVVRRVVNNWDELSVSYPSAIPADDGAFQVDWSIPDSKDVYVDCDITDIALSCYVDKLPRLNLAIGGKLSTKTNVIFQSKEGANRPQLIIDFEDRTTQHDVDEALNTLSLGDITSVQKDIMLPTQGAYGTNVAWATNLPDVLTTDGKVTRPAADSDNVVVELTATVSKEGALDKSKTFYVTVLSNKTPIDDTFVVSAEPTVPKGAANTLIIKHNDPKRAIFVKYDLSRLNGALTSAKYRMKSAYDFEGNNVSPSTQVLIAVDNNDWDENTLTYDTAKIMLQGSRIIATGTFYSGSTGYIEFDITDYANEKLVSSDKEMSFMLYTMHPDVNFNYYSKEHIEKPVLDVSLTQQEPLLSLLIDKSLLTIPNLVTNRLILPAMGEHDSSIQWVVSHSAINQETGEVTRPAQGMPDAIGSIRAVLTKGGQSVEKNFTVNVPAYRGMLVDYSFETTASVQNITEADAFTVTASYTNDSPLNATAMLIVAKYTEGGILTEVQFGDQTVSIEPNEQATITMLVDASEMTPGGMIKIMSWEDLMNIHPYEMKLLTY